MVEAPRDLKVRFLLQASHSSSAPNQLPRGHIVGYRFESGRVLCMDPSSNGKTRRFMTDRAA